MWEIPALGDIVWCRFPQRPRDIPGPKSRPSLVVSITEYEDGVVLKLAYGTSQKTDRLYAGEFVIRKSDNKAAYEMAGLSFDTKFNLRQLVDVPWNDRFFSVAPKPAHGQTPKMGSLHINMKRAFEAAAQAIS